MPVQLPDTNFWLALAFAKHEHHGVASEWFDRKAPRLCQFCRVTQMGFLRLATLPEVMGDDVLNMQGAWVAYDAFLADPRVGYVAAEPIGLDVHWRRHTRRRTPSHRVWTDAYLAAFAEAAGLELVTFDRGFTALKGPRLTLLT